MRKKDLYKPNPAAMLVHWLKLSRGCVMETRCSYGIRLRGAHRPAERLIKWNIDGEACRKCV